MEVCLREAFNFRWCPPPGATTVPCGCYAMSFRCVHDYLYNNVRCTPKPNSAVHIIFFYENFRNAPGPFCFPVFRRDKIVCFKKWIVLNNIVARLRCDHDIMAGYEVDVRLIAMILLGICVQHPRFTQRNVYFS